MFIKKPLKFLDSSIIQDTSRKKKSRFTLYIDLCLRGAVYLQSISALVVITITY
ncbi:UNVERIFIED_ORG: hypothetical protein QFZ59_004426 [Bacillus sp. B2I3]|nr:hypothetical protein [Bacillus sp. B2I3]